MEDKLEFEKSFEKIESKHDYIQNTNIQTTKGLLLPRLQSSEFFCFFVTIYIIVNRVRVLWGWKDPVQNVEEKTYTGKKIVIDNTT